MARRDARQVHEIIRTLRMARLVRRVTQAQVALQLGVSVSAISRWEIGWELPIVTHLLAYAVMVDCEVRVLDASGEVLGTTVGEGEPLGVEDAWLALAHGLRVARRRAGMTQRDLGVAVGASRWSMQMWEKGHRHPKFGRLFIWADKLGCRIEVRERGTRRG